jgi:hypothetical protein
MGKINHILLREVISLDCGMFLSIFFFFSARVFFNFDVAIHFHVSVNLMPHGIDVVNPSFYDLIKCCTPPAEQFFKVDITIQGVYKY